MVKVYRLQVDDSKAQLTTHAQHTETLAISHPGGARGALPAVGCGGAAKPAVLRGGSGCESDGRRGHQRRRRVPRAGRALPVQRREEARRRRHRHLRRHLRRPLVPHDPRGKASVSPRLHGKS